MHAAEQSGVFISACKPCVVSTGCVLFSIYSCLKGGFRGGAVIQGNTTSLGHTKYQVSRGECIKQEI